MPARFQRWGVLPAAGMLLFALLGCATSHPDHSAVHLPDGIYLVSATVVESSGKPLRGCSTAFTGSPEDGGGMTEEAQVTDESGMVGKGLPPGRYQVQAACVSDDGDGLRGWESFSVVDEAVSLYITVD